MVKHLVLVLVLSSCSKNQENYIFDCSVIAEPEGVPLSGVTFTVSGKRVTGSSFNPNFQPLGSGITDAQGKLFLEVDKAVFSTFQIALDHPDHFSSITEINSDDVPTSGPYERQFTLQPLAWVRTRILNTEGSQRIALTVNAPSNGGEQCCDQLSIIHQGAVFDTTFTCMAFGGQAVTHTGNFQNMEGNTLLIDRSHITLAHDTVAVIITY